MGGGGGGGAGVNFNYLPQRGGAQKFLKSGWIYGAGAGLLKGWAGTFHFFFFSRFIILEITLSFAKLCYAFQENFFCLPS